MKVHIAQYLTEKTKHIDKHLKPHPIFTWNLTYWATTTAFVNKQCYCGESRRCYKVKKKKENLRFVLIGNLHSSIPIMYKPSFFLLSLKIERGFVIVRVQIFACFLHLLWYVFIDTISIAFQKPWFVCFHWWIPFHVVWFVFALSLLDLLLCVFNPCMKERLRVWI